jgi:hypothetical protein
MVVFLSEKERNYVSFKHSFSHFVREFHEFVIQCYHTRNFDMVCM